MAQEWAKSFYNSKAWRQVSRNYMLKRGLLCERCGGLAKIVHHKTWLTAANINDINIALGEDNLEALCQECHNKEHMSKDSKAVFDSDGNIVRVKESKDIYEYKQALKELEKAGL